MKIALIDIGNTTTVTGVSSRGKISHVGRISTKKGLRLFSDKGELLHGFDGIKHSILCSVVPDMTPVWEKKLKKITGKKPFIVSNSLDLGIEISYPSPASMGGDRLANAAGATYHYGFPVVVADFGTALTFDVIDSDNKYIGGAIAPGLSFMTEYLASETALLPRIKISGRCDSIGKSTAGAMRLGARVGYSGMVEGLTEHFRKELNAPKMQLILTGGNAGLIGKYLKIDFILDPKLTLKGLRRIYELNTKQEIVPVQA